MTRRAYVIEFRSRRDDRMLGWGIYSEFPLSDRGGTNPTIQNLLFFVDADSFGAAQKVAEIIIGNTVILPSRKPRYLHLSQALRKTVLSEPDRPLGSRAHRRAESAAHPRQGMDRSRNGLGGRESEE